MFFLYFHLISHFQALQVMSAWRQPYPWKHFRILFLDIAGPAERYLMHPGKHINYHPYLPFIAYKCVQYNTHNTYTVSAIGHGRQQRALWMFISFWVGQPSECGYLRCTGVCRCGRKTSFGCQHRSPSHLSEVKVQGAKLCKVYRQPGWDFRIGRSIAYRFLRHALSTPT